MAPLYSALTENICIASMYVYIYKKWHAHCQLPQTTHTLTTNARSSNMQLNEEREL